MELSVRFVLVVLSLLLTGLRSYPSILIRSFSINCSSYISVLQYMSARSYSDDFGALALFHMGFF